MRPTLPPLFHVKQSRAPHSPMYWLERAIFQAEMFDLSPEQYERAQTHIMRAEMYLQQRGTRADRITLKP